MVAEREPTHRRQSLNDRDSRREGHGDGVPGGYVTRIHGVTPLLHLRHLRYLRRRRRSWHVGLHVGRDASNGSGGGGTDRVGNTSSELATRLSPGTCWPSG